MIFPLIQIVNFALLGVWVFLAFKAIRHLAASNMSLNERGLWLLLILAVPILGAAFYLARFSSHATTIQN